MSLLLSDAILQVRGILNEASSLFWTDTEITYWLKEGCRDFSSKSLLAEDVLSVPLVAGQIFVHIFTCCWHSCNRGTIRMFI